MTFEEILKGIEQEKDRLKSNIHAAVDYLIGTHDYKTIIFYERIQNHINQLVKGQKFDELKRVYETIEGMLKEREVIEETPELKREGIMLDTAFFLMQRNPATAKQIADELQKRYNIEYDSRGIVNTLKKHMKSIKKPIIEYRDKKYSLRKPDVRDIKLYVDRTGGVHTDIEGAINANRD